MLIYLFLLVFILLSYEHLGEHITTATTFLKADQQLFVSAEYPSHLVFPVFEQ